MFSGTSGMIEFSQQWFSVVADVSLKAVLLCILAGLSLRLFRVADSGLRHRVWTGTMIAMLFMPGVVLCVPKLGLPILNPSHLPSPIENRAIGEKPDRQDAKMPDAISAMMVFRDALPASTPMTFESSTLVIDEMPKAVSWTLMTLAIWCSGVLAMLTRLVIGFVAATSMRQASTEISRNELLEIGLPARSPLLSQNESLRIAECPLLHVPIVAGAFRPTILLPPEWLTWSPEKLQDVLSHEYSHVKRGDGRILLLAELNRCIYWFHPLAWWLQTRISVLAEHPCDDAAIEAAEGNRRRYACHLLEIAEQAMLRNGRFSRTAISMARNGRVESRISLILDGTRPLTKQMSWSRCALLTILTVLVTAATASLRITHAQQGDIEKHIASHESTSVNAEDISAEINESSTPVHDPPTTAFAAPLTGQMIVARVNGKPISLADVVPNSQFLLERMEHQPGVSERHFQKALRDRLPRYVDTELAIQACSKSFPAERQKQVRDSLEPSLKQLLGQICKDRQLDTLEQLDDFLATTGYSVDILREEFVRQQIVSAYVRSLAEEGQTIEQQNLLKYYDDHIADYTTKERLRCSEIVVRYSSHGGAEGAKQMMNRILAQLNEGNDFNDLAYSSSDNLSAQMRGDLGWISRGSLTDSSLEEMLFKLADSQSTSVIERDDKLEIYKVFERQKPQVTPFEDVAADIQQKLHAKAREEAIAKVWNELRSHAVVETMFDAHWNSDLSTSSSGK